MNGVADATTYVSSTQVTAVVPAAQVASGAKLAVVAVNGDVSSSAGTQPMLEVDNPAPTISGLAPAAIATGSGATTVTVTGTGFVPTTAIQVNGSARSTTYISATQVSLALTAADVTAAGSLSLTAVNATPGGGSSSAAAVAVNDPAPGAILLNPSTSAAGTTTATTVTGSNFIAASTVLVGGAAHATTVASGTQLSFQLSVADQATVGSLNVTVVNPAPGGGSSPVATFTVAAATSTPVISTVNPTSFVEGSSDTEIDVFGNNLQNGEQVQWNGTALVTNGPYYYGYGTYLAATVPASLMAVTGTASITVNNPTALTPISNALSVSVVNPPAPTLTSISPNYGPINTATAIALTGTGFTGNSTVAYNGTALTATYVNSTQLTVTLPASSAAVPGNGNFTVTTPAPGGGTTPALVYSAYIPLVNNSTIYNPVNGLIYASIPGSVGAPLGNSIVSVNPATGVIGTPIFVGSEPNKLALTADGRYLWVGLDGASAVRQVDLTAGTAGLQFSLPASTVYYGTVPTTQALAALPGAANSVVVASGNGSYAMQLSIYDSGVERANVINTSYGNPFALSVNGSLSEIYAGGSGLYTYTYNSNGLTIDASNASVANVTFANGSYDEMQLASGKIYTDFGTVNDAEAGTLLGTLYQSGTTVAQGSTYADTTLGKIFVVDNATSYFYSGYTQIQIFNASDYTTSGTTIPVNVPAYFGTSYTYTTAKRMTRWGANGLAFTTAFGIYSLESNAVKDLSTTLADLGVSVTATGANTTGSTTTFTATVTNNGPSTATDVVLTAGLPSSGTLVSATASTGSCGTTGAVSCALGSLANGATATVTMTVLETASGSSTVTAQVSGSTTDSVSTNNSATATATITGSAYNSAPTVSSISPSTIEAGIGDATITVTGANFSSASSVLLGGSALTTTYVSATELMATVPSANLQTLGWAAISVSNPAPGGGTSQAVPLTVFSVVSLGANHIVFDPYSRKIMASVSSTATTVTGNSVVAVTPETGVVGTPVSIGSQPTEMALTDDGTILYSILSGSQSVSRYNMLTGAAEYSYTPPTPNNTTLSLVGIGTMPGTENTIALDSNAYLGNVVIDFTPSSQTATVRGTATNYYSGYCPQFLDASDLYDYGSGIMHTPVTSTGQGTTTTSAIFDESCFKLSGGLGYTSLGGIFAPANAAVQVATLPGLSQYGVYGTPVLVAPDSSLERSFYPIATTSGNSVQDGVAGYDLNTYRQNALVPLNMGTIEGNTTYTWSDLIRWGQDGLAVLTSGGHIYLLRGPVVVPQLLNANTAATLGSSSTSTITHGAGNTLLTLTGTNFVPGVAVTWNGSYRTTTIVDATHVTVAIPASDLAAAGSGALVATNPGASASGALTVTIN